jgi:hypothetical protein
MHQKSAVLLTYLINIVISVKLIHKAKTKSISDQSPGIMHPNAYHLTTLYTDAHIAYANSEDNIQFFHKN